MSDSANYVILNFDKKRSVPNEIQSEVEVSVVKMIVITRDDCIRIHHECPYRIGKSHPSIQASSLVGISTPEVISLSYMDWLMMDYFSPTFFWTFL